MSVVLAPPHAVPDAAAKTSILDKATWREQTALRREVWLSLCRRGDPPPRELIPGDGAAANVCDNVNSLLSKSQGALPVRGWKVLLLKLEGLERTMWQALAHVVVLRKGALVDPTEELLGAYVFLPSTRLLPKMADEDLLCGSWTLPSVIGGAREFKTQMCIRHPRDLAPSPEEVVPRKLQRISVPRGVVDWAGRRFPGRDIVSLLETMKVARGADYDRVPADSLNGQFYNDVKHIERTSATGEVAQERLDGLLDDLYARS
jgi:hypothetical protein